MFGTIGLIISAIGALKSLKDIFWSKKSDNQSSMPRQENSKQSEETQKFPNGCDAPICRNPDHQHEKDLKDAITKCRKKRFF